MARVVHESRVAVMLLSETRSKGVDMKKDKFYMVIIRIYRPKLLLC